MSNKYSDEEMIGRRFGRLVVLEKSGHIGLARAWLCKCDCGNSTRVVTTNLIKGFVSSCGCNVPNKLPSGEANRNSLFNSYRYRSKKRGLEFALSKKKFTELTSGNCFYCGAEPSNERRKQGTNGPYQYNGIDRIDSSLGYVEDNCVSCCMHCNYMKGILDQNEFLSKIQKILEYVRQGNVEKEKSYEI
jgi:hypothetical protein